MRHCISVEVEHEKNKNLFNFDPAPKTCKQKTPISNTLNLSEISDPLNIFQKDDLNEDSSDEQSAFKWPGSNLNEIIGNTNDAWGEFNQPREDDNTSLSCSEESNDSLLRKQREELLQNISDSNSHTETSEGGFKLVKIDNKEDKVNIDRPEWHEDIGLIPERNSFGYEFCLKDLSHRKSSTDNLSSGLQTFAMTTEPKEDKKDLKDTLFEKNNFSEKGLFDLDKKSDYDDFGTIPKFSEDLTPNPDFQQSSFQQKQNNHTQPQNVHLLQKTVYPPMQSPNPQTHGFQYPAQPPKPLHPHNSPNPNQMNYPGFVNYPPMFPGNQLGPNYNMMPRYPPTNFMSPMMPYPNMPSGQWVQMMPTQGSPVPVPSNSNGNLLAKPPMFDGLDRNERLYGRLKFYNEVSKFGFLIKEKDNGDIFFHLTDMENSGITVDILMGKKSCLEPSFDCPHRSESEKIKKVG
jgi:hypothetical protein